MDVLVPSLLGAAQPVDAGWTFAPIIIVALLLYVAIYVRRWRVSRREGGSRAAGYGRLALWLTGIALLAVALLSPVDRLGEQFATFHMVQHLLLADLVPICLTLALTKHILRPVTRRIHRVERAAGPFGHPAFGVIAYALAMWVWHIPVIFEAAVHNPWLHLAQHTSFFVPAAMFWWSVFSARQLGSVISLFTTMLHTGTLGALMTFSRSSWYAGYALEDQQLAGLVMWVPAGLVYPLAALWLVARSLRRLPA